MVGGRDGRHGNTQPDWGDLCTIEEVGAEEANWDEEVEQEDENHSRCIGSRVARREAGADAQRHHAKSHASPGDHEQYATTETIDCEEGYKARQELPC